MKSFSPSLGHSHGLISFFSLLTILLGFTQAKALNYYWVNGSGQWSDFAHHWAKTPSPAGPSDFHANVPTASDDVFFGNTNGGAAYIVDVNAGSTVPKCHNMDWTGAPPGAIWGGGGGRMDIYGSLSMDANMSMTFNNQTHFVSNDASMKPIWSKTVHFSGQVYFEGTAGGWQFQDEIYFEEYVAHHGGLIETNNQKTTVTVNWFGNYFGSDGQLHLGSSEFIILYGIGYMKYHSGQFDAGNSHIKLYGASSSLDGPDFFSSAITFYDVSFYGSLATGGDFAWGNIAGTLTFHQFGRIYSSSYVAVPKLNKVVFLGDGIIYNATNYHHLTLTAGKTYTIGTYSSIYNTDQTILPGGTLTALGAGTCSQFIKIKSTDYGTSFNFVNNSGAIQTVHCAIMEDCHATGSDPMECLDGVNLGNTTGWSFVNPHGNMDLYWVGGAGNWHEPSHWSDTDGGAPGTCIPNGATNVHFTALSGFAFVGQVVVSADEYCADMDWTGVVNVPHFIQDFGGNIKIYGNIKLVPPTEMVYEPVSTFFRAPGAQTIECAGQVFASAKFEGNGSWDFLDSFKVNNLIHNDGTIHTLGNPILVYSNWLGNYIDANGGLADKGAELWLGTPGGNSSTVYLLNDYGEFSAGYEPNHFHAVHSTIFGQGGDLVTGYPGREADFYDVTFTPELHAGSFLHGNILHKLTYQGGANLIGQNTFIHEAEFHAGGFIYDDHTFDTLTFYGGDHSYKFQSNGGYGLGSTTQTISANGSFQIINGDCSNLAYLYNPIPGYQTTFKKLGPGTHFDLQYATLDRVYPDNSTGASYTATSSIGLQPDVTAAWNISNMPARNLYWVNGAGSWSDPAHWSLTPGGSGGQCLPTAFDNVYFNAASGLGGGAAVTQDMRFGFCKDIDWTGVAAGTIWNNNVLYPPDPFSGNNMMVFGSLKFSPNMDNQLTGRYYLRANGPAVIKSAGQIFKNDLYFWSDSGKWTLSDDLSTIPNTNITILHWHGELNTNNHAITCGGWNLNYNYQWFNQGIQPSAKLTLGGSKFRVWASNAYAPQAYFYYPQGNFNAGMSEIIFEDSYSPWGNLGANATYPIEFYDITFKGANNTLYGGQVKNNLIFEQKGTITDGFPINNLLFKDDGSFILYSGYTGKRDVHAIKFAPGKRYDFQSGFPLNIVPDNGQEGQFIAQGLPGQYIEMKSTDPNVSAIIHMDDYNGTSTCTKYLFLTGMQHTGTEDIYVPTPGGNVFNSTGWQFFPCNPCPATIPVLDPASITSGCPPGKAKLMLAGLKPDEWAIWYSDPAATANIVYNGGQPGPMGNIFMPDITGPATYYARVYSDGGLCESTVILTVAITVISPPTSFNVTGGGLVCQGSNGVAVGLDGSATGVSYQLLWNGSNLGVPIAGTGQPVSFGLQTAQGIYTVVANADGTSCAATMNGSAGVTLSTDPAPVVATGTNAPFCTDAQDLMLFENGGEATSWAWTGPNGFSSSQQSLVIPPPNFTAQGLYSVSITGANGCGNVGQVSVILNTTYNITGNIIRADCSNMSVPNVNLTLFNGNYSYTQTNTQGDFAFNDEPCNIAYTITPTKNTDYVQGVDVLDLLGILQHAYGIVPLNSPYKMIAADANKSGSITVFDVQELRKLILGTYPQLPNNDSWRFVPQDYVFPNPNNPFSFGFPEYDVINPLSGNTQSDFYGIKVGDVTGCDLTPGPPTVEFVASDTMVAECGSWVNITVNNFTNVMGFQFSLNWDPSMIQYLELGDANTTLGLDFNNFGLTQTPAGTLSVAWNNNNYPLTGISLPNGTVLFRIKLRAIGSGGTTNLVFADTPTPRLVVNGQMQPFFILQHDGILTKGNSPVALCHDTYVTFNPGDCAYSLSPFDVDNGSYDDCALASLDVAPQELPLGITTVTLTATDNLGLTSTCQAQVTVSPYPNPSTTLDCKNNFQVSLGADCAVCIGADMVLIGGPYGCFNNYNVDIDKTPPFGNGPWVSACVGATDLNKTYMIRVTDPSTGNKCWGTVTIIDDAPPTCVAPPNVTVSCINFDPSLAAYGFATGTDNCCLLGVTEFNNYQLFDTVCNKGTIIRKFTSTDCSGNTASCFQRVVTQYTQHYFIKFPDDILVDACTGINNFGAPEFLSTGCELLATSFSDQIINSPDACLHIERTWKIYNACTYNPNLGCTVVPNPHTSSIPYSAANQPGPIVSAAGTPAPWAPTVTKINPSDPSPTNFSFFWNQNANCYEYTQHIRVIDNQPPVISCPSSAPQICDGSANDNTLWNKPYWVDPVTGFNDLKEVEVETATGATDVCYGANITARFLLFLDLDNDGYQETVVNSANLPDFNTVHYGNAGNPNYTGGTPRAFDSRGVPIGDKYGFALQTYTIGDHLYARVAWHTANNPGLYSLPQLPYGTHKIKWYFTDDCGNESSCEYLLVVPWTDCSCNPAFPDQTYCPGESVPLFVPAGFPSGVNISWTNDNPAIGLPASGTGALPPFTALNYCPTAMTAHIAFFADYQSAGLSCPNPPPSEFTITVNPGQVVLNPGDQVVCDSTSTAPVSFTGSQNGMTYTWYNDNTTIGLPTQGTGDIGSFTALNPGTSPSTAHIHVVPSGISGLLCPTPVPADFTITVNPLPIMNTPVSQLLCGGQYTVATIFNSNIPASYTWINDHPAIGLPASGSGNVPAFPAQNNTGAPITATITVTPKGGDAMPPIINCIGGLSISLLPNGLINLYAYDFIQFVEDNFTPANQLKIGIRKAGVGTGFPQDIYGNPEMSILFDCSSLGSQEVEVWAQDECGNADYCISTVFINNNSGSCAGDKMVSGQVVTENGDGVANVAVTLTGPGVSRTVMTNSVGNYTIPEVVDGQSYQLCLYSNDNPLNGVSTYDLVLINKHITGVELLNSPYKIIAADVDHNGVVDPNDVTEANNLILGNYSTFPHNTSWRFVPADYVFPDPANPLIYNFPDGCISVTLNGSNLIDKDFIGIKIADVNNSAVANKPNKQVAAHKSLSSSGTCDGCFGAPVTFTITVNPQPQATAASNMPLCKGSDLTLQETGGQAVVWSWSGPNNFSSSQQNNLITNIQPYQTGDYYVIVTGANGCTNIGYTNVDLQPSPVIQNCPSNIVVPTDPGTCTAVVFYAEPVVSSPCFNVTTTLAGLPPGSIFPISTSFENYLATDDAGNTAACAFTVTVLDQEPPLANCKNAILLLDTYGNATLSEQDINDNSVDNCSYSLNYAINQTAFSCSQLGNQPVTLTVTDASGNSAQCSATVSVQDQVPPVFINCPGNITVPNSLDKCGAYVVFTAPSATDNCIYTTVALSSGLMPGDFYPVGVTHQVYSAIDGSGNVSNCQFDITVMDMQLPTAVCRDRTVSLDNNGQSGINAADIDGGSSDNCPMALSMAITASNFSCANIGDNNITLTVTDAAGNSSICVATVTIRDVTAPLITACPPNTTVDNCKTPIPDYIQNLVATDNCTVVSMSQIPSPGVLFGASSGVVQAIVYTVTDASGNTSTCSSTVSVLDNINPVFANCPANITTGCDVDNCGAHVIFTLPTATDNCELVSILQIEGPASGALFGPGTSTVAFVATDASGNTGSCHFTVSVTDIQAPRVTCPAGIYPFGTNNNSCNYTQNGTAMNAVATDNCGLAGGNTGLSFTLTGTTTGSGTTLNNVAFNPGLTVVSWTATDIAGNTSTCSYTMSVSDDDAPTITSCPPNVIVNTSSNGAGDCTGSIPNLVPNLVASDNCGVATAFQSPASGTIFGAQDGEMRLITFTVQDAAGNQSTCQTTVTLKDNETPTWQNCPTTMLTFGNDPDQCSVKTGWLAPTAQDNCGTTTITKTAGPNPGDVLPITCPPTDYTVTYQANDGRGNTATCSFTIRVADTQKPRFNANILMPGDITVECDNVPQPLVYHNTVLSPLTTSDVSDNCTTSNQLAITFTEASTQGNNPALCNYYTYTLTRTWKVSDCAGNVLVHTQTIQVKDTKAPTAVCKNITVTLDPTGNATITPVQLDGGSFDNCAASAYLTFTAPKTSFNCQNLGANSVTLTVTDPCGNSGTCIAIVTVVEGIGKCIPVYDLNGSDPCTCLNNATTLDNGQFGELVQVWGLAGQTWTVQSATGLYLTSSPAPPAAPVPMPNGMALKVGTADGIDNNGNGLIDEAAEAVYYTLPARHIEGIGYSATFVNNLGQHVDMSNKCYYPTPVFTNLNDPFCVYTPPFTVKAADNYGGAGSVVTWMIDGVNTSTFDAGVLGPGQHTVMATFDAGKAAANLVVNGVLVGVTDAQAKADPGCQQKITKIVSVVPTPTQVTCNDLVYVSIDSTCKATVSVDDVLEGSQYQCYDDYYIVLDYPNGTTHFTPSTMVDATHIGKTFTYHVYHHLSGNTCWGHIKVEDKLAPKLKCPQNVTIACSESTDPMHAGNITIQDCSTTATVMDDNLTDNGECGNPRAQIVRIWYVTDAWGNQSTCLHTVTIIPFSLANVVFPADVTVNCEAAYHNPAATQPDQTGRPSINGAAIGTGGWCSASINYTDEIYNICTGSYEILRNWKVRNTCLGLSNDNPASHIQIIRVKDAAGPVFTCPPGVTVSTDPTGCCATNKLPGVVISEGCSAISNLQAKVTGTDPATGNVITFTVPGALVDFPGNNYWTPDTLAAFGYTQCMPVGTYIVRYTAQDGCNNTSACQFSLTVQDLIPPVALCDQKTTVAIGGDDPSDCYTPADGCTGAGVTWVKAMTFNDGSYDNCNKIKLAVRRMAPYNTCIDGLPKCEKDIAIAEADSIKFYCCEVGTTQTVVLRAYQVDAYGQIMVGTDSLPIYNECMIQVEVQDKIKPACQPPAHVTVSCENFDPGFSAYGNASVADNCCLDTSKIYQGQCGLSHTVNYSQFDTVCNKGTIVRTFRAWDCHGLSSQCTQRVVVNYKQDYFVRFPDDKLITKCDGTGNYGEPTFYGKDCELLAVSYNDEIFTVVPDACFKIERTWSIINWCTFNPNLPYIYVPNPNPNPAASSPQNLPGPVVSSVGTPAPWAPTIVKINPTDVGPTNYATYYNDNANGYQFKQIIKIIDTQDPVIGSCPATDTVCDVTDNDVQLWNEMDWWDNVITSHDLCEAPAPVHISATDSCNASALTFRYLLFLDLDNDGVMETVINSNNPPAAGTVDYGNASNPNYTGGSLRIFDERPVPALQKYRFALQTTTNGKVKTGKLGWNTDQLPTSFTDARLPYGKHKIKWIVEDGCGNEAVCEYPVIVKDCKKPTVVCLNGLSVNIMATGMIQIWATDFLQYATDNCTPSNQLKVGIRRSGTGTGFPVDANGNPVTSVIFTCADLGTQTVELWAMDAAGNADFCTTYIIVQDNAGNCISDPTKAKVAGILATEQAGGLQDGGVQIDGDGLGIPAFTFTTNSDTAGWYHFNGIPLSSNATVTPVKDDNPFNGVSTYDLVLISKHILGIQPLGSPYRMIAADANKNGSVTTFDIVEIRKLILGIYTEFPNNTSWRFVDKSYLFPNPANPFSQAFPENKAIVSLSGNTLDQDFVSIKVGDVNGSAIPNAWTSINDRSDGTLLFDIDDRGVKTGETFAVAFKATQAVQGYQFTINVPGFEVLDIIPGTAMKAEHFAVFAKEGAITTSWDAPIGQASNATFEIKLRALKSGRLSDLITVSSRITKAEAYSSADKRMEVAFRFNDGATSTIAGVGFELYQNVPNPFTDHTVIGFHLPEAATVQLTVYDETGRLVYGRKGDFGKGYNTFYLDKSLIEEPGVLYYKVETAAGSATKEMIETR